MKWLLLFICSVIICCAATAQEPVPKPKVDKLVLNSSPAYFLLGVQPDNIQRPSTPRDFIGGVQTAVVNQQLQPNFAIETNPFNWNTKDSIKNQFYANDYFYKSRDAIKKNFSLSLATSSSDTVVFGKLKPGMGLGYGLRVTLVPGQIDAAITEAFYKWEVAEIKSIFLDILKSQVLVGQTNLIKSNIDQYLKQTTDRVEKNMATKVYILESNKEEVFKELQLLADSYRNVDNAELENKVNADRAEIMAAKEKELVSINTHTIGFERQGFMLEFAAAGVTVFQNNKFGDSYHGKTAIWLTPSYRWSLTKGSDHTTSFDLMGVVRYIWNPKIVDTSNYLDAGLKVQFNKVKWNTSLEWEARYASKVPENTKSNWTNCWLYTFNYTLHESTSFKFSFGSNFDGNTRTYTNKNDMIVVAGINLGL